MSDRPKGKRGRLRPASAPHSHQILRAGTATRPRSPKCERARVGERGHGLELEPDALSLMSRQRALFALPGASTSHGRRAQAGSPALLRLIERHASRATTVVMFASAREH